MRFGPSQGFQTKKSVRCGKISSLDDVFNYRFTQGSTDRQVRGPGGFRRSAILKISLAHVRSGPRVLKISWSASGPVKISLVRVRSGPWTGPDLLVRADQRFGPWIPAQECRIRYFQLNLFNKIY